jgi:hypothetical protein
MMKTNVLKATRRALLVAAASAATLAALAAPAAAGRWVSGDVHNHTYLSDGSSAFADVARNAFSVYGLDYLGNCDHGGFSTKDPNGLSFVSPVPRWLTLSNYSYPTILAARATYPERRVLQGVEWNAPTHEHVVVGIVGAGNEPRGVSDFEYLFDAADTDASRSGEGTKAVTDPATGTVFIPAVSFAKTNVTNDDMLAGCTWLEDNYLDQSYAIVAHPSRKDLWQVGDFRAMNDAAPDVCFGFEGMPGHQASVARGEYGTFIGADGKPTDAAHADETLTAHARTYGGADWMTATVGGAWDALLGEGRHWWVFNDSDYHVTQTTYKDASGNVIGVQYKDFWPGQYAKTYTYVSEFTDDGLVAGMRSGDSFIVNGDLINGLRFKVSDGKHSATMGGTLLTSAGKTLTVSIAVHSPQLNNNLDKVRLDHVDVITGDVTGPLSPSDPAYTTQATNPSAKVAKQFPRAKWKTLKGGWKSMTYTVKVSKDMYLRLRGTNWADGTTDQTDAQGNPLVDTLDYVDFPNPADGGATTLHGNTPDNAWADLWFYSNPVFIDVK